MIVFQGTAQRSFYPITNHVPYFFFRKRNHDQVYEEIHDTNPVHGRVGPRNVLHRRSAFPWRIPAGRKKLCYLQVGQRPQVSMYMQNF